MKNRILGSAVLLFSLFVFTSQAVIGVGVHYGVDLSMGMDPTSGLGERISVIKDSVTLDLPNGQSRTVIADSLPLLFITRQSWERSPLNIGAKVYVDMLPFVDEIELSCNLGMWQYLGSLQHIDLAALKEASLTQVDSIMSAPYSYNYPYRSVALTLKNFDMGYFGLQNTPYAKFHVDASVKWKILPLPLLKVSAGGGLSMHFATPVLSSKLVEEVLADQKLSYDQLANLDQSTTDAIYKKVVEKIISGFTQPSFGAHLVASARFKLPLIPMGLYMDGKLMIPIGSVDPNTDLNAVGFLINSGVSLSF